jgi:hypothetical protein
MCNVKTNVIPVIIGEAGTISKSFIKYLSNKLAKQEIKNYRKQPYWAQHTYCGKHKCKSKINLILELPLHAPLTASKNSCNTVFPRDMVGFRNISVNTLHKGDDDDNNNTTDSCSQT